MANRPPEHCPYCGTALRVDAESVSYYCESCDSPVFYNPTPNARVAVVDGDRLLLQEIAAAGAENRWTTPGGHVQVGEDPSATAARELEEETGLSADPTDLVLFDARTFEKFEGSHKTWLLYAVVRDRTTGELRPDGDEASAVRFWTPDELDRSEHVLTSNQPSGYRTLASWLDSVRAAVCSAE